MNWMTQVLVLFYRICTLKAQCSLSIKNPSEHTSPPTDTLSASLPQPYSGDAARYQEASKSFLYSSMCKLPFLLILQSVNIPTLPKTKEKRKRERPALVHRCVTPFLYSMVQKVPLWWKYHMKRESYLHKVQLSIAPPIPIIRDHLHDKVMLVVHKEARLQWANLILHTCLFMGTLENAYCVEVLIVWRQTSRQVYRQQ